jgi:uncharacterized membrane protein
VARPAAVPLGPTTDRAVVVAFIAAIRYGSLPLEARQERR